MSASHGLRCDKLARQAHVRGQRFATANPSSGGSACRSYQLIVSRQLPLRSTAKHSAQVAIPTLRPCRSPLFAPLLLVVGTVTNEFRGQLCIASLNCLKKSSYFS